MSLRQLTQLALGLAALPSALAWGSLGHITVAYVASDLVAPSTTTFLQRLLANSSSDYLAGVATWADTIRYTKWGKFTGPFHFIDAKDSIPDACSVDLERDCKAAGCVVSAIHNYTTRLMDSSLTRRDNQDAAKFLVHFIGDIHQPLHAEDVAKGGNEIHVVFRGAELKLHHVWDTSIAEAWIGGVRGKPFDEARKWATTLVGEIKRGKFRSQAQDWGNGINLGDPTATALLWARQSNAYVCSTVFPDGVAAIEGKELGGAYYEMAGPVVEIQIARAGFRLAAWLDLIAASIRGRESPTGEEL